MEIIDNSFYEKEIGIKSYISKSKVRDKDKNYSEEYIRARFVYFLIYSGKYDKENICVEFSFPKGSSSSKPIKPDIVVFKNKIWVEQFNNKDYVGIRQNLLVIFETKKKR